MKLLSPVQELKLKTCILCGFHRAEPEPVCLICSHDAFEPAAILPDLGYRLAAGNRWKDAYDCFESQVASNPDDGPACLALAWLAYVVRDLRAVETWAHEAMRLMDRAAEPHLLMALVLRNATRWEEALEELEAAARRNTLSPGRRLILEDLTRDVKSHIKEW
jgi:tetratricopeptide (TPR) repeat protein